MRRSKFFGPFILPLMMFMLFVVPGSVKAWSTPYTQAPTVFSNLWGTTHGGNWCGTYMCPRNVYVDYYPMLTDGTSNTSLIPGSVVTVDASFQTTRFEIYPGQTNYLFGNCTNANASGNLYYFYSNSSYYQNPPGLFCVQTPGFDPSAWGNPYGLLGSYGHPTSVYNPSGYQSAYPAYTVAVITPTPTITSSNPAVISCAAGTSCTSQSVGSATLTVTFPATYSEEYEAWCWGGPGCGYVFSHTLPGGSYYYGPHAVVPATSVSFLATVNPAANPPPTITFLNAQQNTIPVNTSAKLFWNTFGVGTITCNGTASPVNALWGGPQPTTFFGSGFTTSPLTADTTFTLTCSSVWGSDTKSRTVTVITPNTSTAPTITGPATLATGVNGTYTFTATDPQGDQVRYGIDWDMDSVADEWLPAGVTYVNSGTPQSTTHSWVAPGAKTFQALTQDFQGLNSAWTVYSVTVATPSCGNGAIDPPTCNTCAGGYSMYLAVCYANCVNGATNPPICNACVVGQTYVAGSCVNNCTNGAINPPACNACPGGQALLAGVCTNIAVCGNGTCDTGENPLTCAKDCKVKYKQF